MHTCQIYIIEKHLIYKSHCKENTYAHCEENTYALVYVKGECTPSSSPYRGPHRWSSSCQECQERSEDPAYNVNIYSNLVPSIKNLGHSRPLHHNPVYSLLSPSTITRGESRIHNGSHNSK